MMHYRSSYECCGPFIFGPATRWRLGIKECYIYTIYDFILMVYYSSTCREYEE